MAERLAWWRMYAGDFGNETAHLPAAQVGHFVRLLNIAWMRVGCAIPADRAWIMRRLRIADKGEYERHVVPLLADFWQHEGDEYVCQQMLQEYHHAETVSEQRRSAANKRHHGGGKVHSLNLKEK